MDRYNKAVNLSKGATQRRINAELVNDDLDTKLDLLWYLAGFAAVLAVLSGLIWLN